MKHAVIVLGNIQIEQCLSVAEFPRKGETVKAQDYQIHASGKGGVQALTVVRCGGSCALIACIGHDAIGQQVKADLTHAGVNTDAVQILPHLQTGVSMRWTSENGDTRTGIAAGANAALTPTVLIPYLPLLADAAYVLMQLTIPIATVELAARHARAHGTCVVLDPSPAEVVTPALLRLVDILLPNVHSMELLTGMTLLDDTDCQHACAILHAYGIHWIILTLGEQGIWVSERDHAGYRMPAYPVQTVDVNAAGDVFAGALVGQLAEKQPWAKALPFALAAAACSTMKPGCYSAVPDHAEVQRLLQARC